MLEFNHGKTCSKGLDDQSYSNRAVISTVQITKCSDNRGSTVRICEVLVIFNDRQCGFVVVSTGEG